MIDRWAIITIGNLSRNRYWGESDDRAYRPAMCTCTLITIDGRHVLVDPSLKDAQQMGVQLERRTGVKPDEIDTVFLSHGHGDHHFGLAHFPRARWLAAPDVAEELNRGGQYDKPVEAVEGAIAGEIELLHTPGHTLNHHSLRFDCDGRSVIVAADAAMTRDFWRDRRGYFNSADFELAARSIDRLATIADVVIPGHDNWFLNDQR